MAKKKTKGARLIAKWGKPDRFNDPDVIADGDDEIPRSHKRLLIHALCTDWRWANGTTSPSLVDQLTALGYDITTLRFSIRKVRP